MLTSYAKRGNNHDVLNSVAFFIRLDVYSDKYREVMQIYSPNLGFFVSDTIPDINDSI